MTLVYVFGSGECEQLGKMRIKMRSLELLTYILGLGDDQPFEIKKPRKIPFFDVGGGL
jgi:hypothetical protein